MNRILKQAVALGLVLSVSLGIVGSYAAIAAATTLRVVQTRTVYLYTGQSTSATTARITPYPKDLDGTKLTITDFGTNPTFTVDPKISGTEEIQSFTGITDNGDGTATLTGITRNLTSKYPYTTAGTGRTHGAGAAVVFGNNPQVYGRLAAWENTGTTTATWAFSSTSVPRYDMVPIAHNSGTPVATTSEFASLAYVNATGAGVNVSATESVRGEVELATANESASSTVTGSTGAGVVQQARYATDTPQDCIGATKSCDVWAMLDGKIRQTWFNLTENWTFTNATIASSSMQTATTTNAFALLTGIFHINGLNYRWPSAIQATSTVLKTNATGSLTWAKPDIQILYSSAGRISGAAMVTIPLPSTGLGMQSKIRATSYCVTNGDFTVSMRAGSGAASSTLWSVRNGGPLTTVHGFATSTSGQLWSAASTSQAYQKVTETYLSNSSQMYLDIISDSAGSYCEGVVVELLNY